MKKLKLPMGIDNFKKIRGGNYLRPSMGIENFEEVVNGYYYVDKTSLIEQVLENGSEVTLFTRPRRFGKSLNMSMLQCFFEFGTDPALFDGLYISQKTRLCEQHLGRYPVIAISLKGVDAASYEDAYNLLVCIVNEEVERFQFLLDSERLTRIDKMRYEELLDRRMEKDTLAVSLRRLTALLEKHYGSQVIVLIDEYDVPLAKAYENGYYDEMVLLIRNLFGNVLKTNSSLAFAVLTGCLRIAKESIFTGLNNFKVYSITNAEFDETFGFTDDEVKEMLHYYELDDRYDEVKEWYDGYRFGNVDVYCPWDVVNYCSDHLRNPNARPENYWMNTSGNSVINHFIDSVNEPDMLTKTELEWLANGKTVRKRVDEMVTYGELYSTIDNLWSTLFMTGYLTQRGRESDGRYCLAVPNREIGNIITERILTLFRSEVKKDGQMAEQFCKALLAENAKEVEQLLTAYLKKTISIRDTFVRKSIKENFYHGILLGILSYKGSWNVSSNRESGEGFSDILIEVGDTDIGIVIEVKYMNDDELNNEADHDSKDNGEGNSALRRECEAALKQIEEKDYAQSLRQDGMRRILKYGIAFQTKNCCVIKS
jgi:hypothetical protein